MNEKTSVADVESMFDEIREKRSYRNSMEYKMPQKVRPKLSSRGVDQIDKQKDTRNPVIH